MKTTQLTFNGNQWVCTSKEVLNPNPDLILCFGNKQLLKHADGHAYLIKTFPGATVIAGSTAGEINNKAIQDDSIVATLIKFNDSKVVPFKVSIKDYADSIEAGKALVAKFDTKGLRFLFVVSDGQLVNGGDLVTGMNTYLNNKIPIAGGLAGDGVNFQSTLVGLNNDLNEGNIVAIGFYGEKLNLGYGSKGGWDQFGPTRTITKSSKNVLHEIDGSNALDLYKKYLGDYADKLPGSALLFPLAIQENDGHELVRTILSIDQDEKTMTFAGNIPEGAKVRLMKANLDNLVEAASEAATQSNNYDTVNGDKLSILISCVGRKIIFGDRIEEEFEAARESVGKDTIMSGFYSYGEISPFSSFMQCELHNQTMTITTLSEA